MKKTRKQQVRRSIAWVLAFAMAVSGLVVPVTEETAQASSTSYDLSVSSGSSNGSVTLEKNAYGDDYISDVLFTIPSQAENKSALSTYGITSMEVTVTINSFSGTKPGVMVYVQPGEDGSWAWNATDTTVLEAGKQITLSYNFSGMDWNGGSTMGNLGLRFADSTEGSTVSYTIDSAILIASGSSGESGGSTSSEWGTTRDYSSGVTATVANQGAPSNDWSGFEMTINNNSGTTICDWIVVLEVPSGTASAFKCWNATFVADGDTIYMYPMQSGANAVVSSGTLTNDVPGGGFAAKYVDASSITVRAVYYNKGSQSGYDYSSGNTNDNNSGGGSGSSSTTDTSTNKDLEVEYNYAKVLQESLYFYDANMCGTGVDENCGLSWRGDCHTDDANVSVIVNGTNYQVDVSGGFHDAGDHVKFGLPQGYAATALGMSYYEFKDAYTELNQAEHLKTITNYFCDYFKRSTIYSDNTNKTGGVVAFCYQVGEGNADHGYWGAPENQTGSRPAYFATASNPGTDEVSVAIAALALNYVNFGNEEDLQVAKDLFAFAQSNSKACATEGAGSFYASSGWQDDYAVAAAALYVATKDSAYQQEYNNYKGNINTGWMMDWDNSGAMASMLMEDWSKLKSIADTKSNGTVLDGVFNAVSDWGSCRYNAALQFCGLVYDKGTGGSTYTKWAESQMRYIIGENPNKRCYIVGYNENSSKYPHHRAASRSSGAGETRDDHYTLLGALVGGPKTNGYYADDQGDYICNEVALDYNVGLVCASAGLYLATKGSTEEDHSETLAGAEELTEIGITKLYGVSASESSAPTTTPVATVTTVPTEEPTVAPTVTAEPTKAPTVAPTVTAEPTKAPTVAPTATVTIAPTVTAEPTEAPTVAPTETPIVLPTITPIIIPTQEPTVEPTATVVPTQEPTVTPVATATAAPTQEPTAKPIATATAVPTTEPTATPIVLPTITPIVIPTQAPTEAPTVAPTVTVVPTEAPTVEPTVTPVATATAVPTEAPTNTPLPSAPATVAPTSTPTAEPTKAPEATESATIKPTVAPSQKPTVTPVGTATAEPTKTPAATATAKPSSSPDVKNTQKPVSTVKPQATSSAAPAFEQSEYTVYVTEELQLNVLNSGNAANIIYASSNVKIGEVDSDGLLKAKKAGVVTITAIISNKTQITCQVTITKPTVKLKKKTLKLKVKKKAKITFKEKLSGDGIKKCKVVGKKVVKVNKKGVVKALKKGKATIKITMKSGVVVKCKVKVK